jgi:hypothetical protein
MPATEFEFASDDPKQTELAASYGLILLQLALIIRKHADVGDREAVNFFDDAFQQISQQAYEKLRRRMN